MGRRAKFAGIAMQIQAQIDTGILVPGVALPPETELVVRGSTAAPAVDG